MVYLAAGFALVLVACVLHNAQNGCDAYIDHFRCFIQHLSTYPRTSATYCCSSSFVRFFTKLTQVQPTLYTESIPLPDQLQVAGARHFCYRLCQEIVLQSAWHL